MFGLHFNPFKSLTIAGAVAGLGATLVGHFDPTALSPGATLGLQAFGALLGTIGIRNAVAKAAAGIIEQLAGKT